MKRILFVLTLALAPACAHPPPTVTTQAGKIAFTADQIVQRVNELQNAAISAEASKDLQTSTARLIVTFCVEADKMLQTTPAGWQATVLKAWSLAKGQIGSVANPAIAAALSAVDVAIASLGG